MRTIAKPRVGSSDAFVSRSQASPLLVKYRSKACARRAGDVSLEQDRSALASRRAAFAKISHGVG